MIGWLHATGVEAWWIPLLLVVFAATFASARRLGIRQGRTEGERTAPIALRAECLRSGVCPICGAGSAAHDSSTVPAPAAAGTPVTPLLEADGRDRV